MSVFWLHRITAAVEVSGRAKRELSKAAGFGVNYVSQMIADGKMPAGNRLASLCDELGVDQRWVLSGVPANPRLDRISEIVADLPKGLSRVAFRYFSNKEVSQNDLRKLSEATGESLDSLRKLARQNSNKSESIAASNGLSFNENLALTPHVADVLDDAVFSIAYEHAIQIEENMIRIGVLSGPASSEARGKMIAMAYAKELVHKHTKK